MPKGSEELTNARKEEIINVCAGLYETMNFKDVGAKTSFTRTLIYWLCSLWVCLGSISIRLKIAAENKALGGML